MNEILTKYKERLINLSGKNRSLVSKKLPKKRGFDLVKLDEFKDGISKEIIKYLIDRDDKRLEILPDYSLYYKNHEVTLKKKIQKEYEENINKIESKNLEETEKQEKLAILKEKYDKKLEVDISKLEKEREKIIDYSVALKALNKEINDISKETGRFELYLGYPFVEGNLKDNTFVRAPLMLFPVRMSKSGDAWNIENITDSNILINKVLLLAIAKHNEVKLNIEEMEFQKLNDNFIEEVLSVLEDSNISIDHKESNLEKFKEYTKDTTPNYKIGELSLEYNVILGQFHIANSIYKDYEEMVSKDIDNKLLEDLLKSDSMDIDIAYIEDEEEHGKLSFSDKELYLVSDLDYSQEKAVLKVNKTNKLVIYGPPGTGKSQTITNIISDALAKDKKVLMVSQKRAALDVIYNRLAILNKKAILIHDTNGDKKIFYGLMTKALDTIEKSDDVYINNILKDARAIDEKIIKFEAIGEYFHKERNYGLSLQEMYSKCKSITSREDSRYEEFRRFRSNNVFDSYKYQELKGAIEKIDDRVISYYNSYKKLADENPFIDDVDLNMNMLDIDEFTDKVRNIINPIKAITQKAKDNKEIYEGILNIFRKNSFSANEEEFIDFAISLNRKLNSNKIANLDTKDLEGIGYWKECINKKTNSSLNIETLGEAIARIKYEVDKIKDLDHSDLSNRLINLFTKTAYYPSKEEINNVAIEVNKEKNGELLIPLNDGKWWSVRYWLKYSDNKKKDIESNEKFVKLKNEYIIECERIYEQIQKHFKNIDEVIKAIMYKVNKDIVSIVSKRGEKLYFDELVNKINSTSINKDRFKTVKDFHRLDIGLLDYAIKGNYTEVKNRFKELPEFITFKYIQEKEEFYNKQDNLIKEVKSIQEHIKKSFNDISIVKKALNERVYNIVVDELLQGEDLTEYFNDIINALNLVEQYRQELRTVRGLNKLQVKILNYSLDNNLEFMKERVGKLLEFTTLYHVLEAEKEVEIQNVIDSMKEFNLSVMDVNKLMNDKRENVIKYILNKLDSEIPLLVNETGYKEFKRQAGKKKLLWPIREYMEKYYDMILDTFPCFLTSPETASEVLPLKEGLFDIVIFDEASQMYVENAIPTIYRGKQVVIAGDDKQLRPNGAFKNRFIDDEEDVEEQEAAAAALEEESLLDLAKVNYDGVYLTYHYRSQYEELINFSNYAFYGGKLKVSPNVADNTGEAGKPIERIMVKGKWIDRQNIEESETVVNLVDKILKEKEKENKSSIGIITFNSTQRECIEEMLDIRAQKDSEFREYYSKEIDRVENNEDISLFVKNIENVQGDERDIIIFSTGYGINEKGRVSVNFGSLSQDGGENRLNVAISRAKQKIYVVTSIEPEELKIEGTKNNGPKLFKKYLQYVREISNGNKESANEILKGLLDSNIEVNTERHHDSDFESEVYEGLVKRGYDVHTQVGVSGYKIDLAIYDKKASKYILGIECDGATYHSSKSARERDIHRQKYLESRGWIISRIWSRNWWENPNKEIEKILQEIKDIQSK